MWKFLWDNKEWLFSGIGIVLLAGIIAIVKTIWNLENKVWFYFIIPIILIVGIIIVIKAILNRRKMQEISSTGNANNKLNLAVANNEIGDSEAKSLFKDITPHQITEAIDRLPLLQRSDAAQHYIGMFVSWRLSLLNISDEWEEPNFVSIHLCEVTNKFIVVSVVIKVNRKEYPGLGLLSKDDIIEVEGWIEKVQDDIIFLSDAKIIY